MEHRQSIVAVSVTGSLVYPTLFSRRDANCTYRPSILCENCDTDWSLPLLDHTEGGTMDADGFSIVDNRAGVTFGVELYVPWDQPEMAIDLSSTGTVPLRNVPDVFGMSGRRDSATESHILQGRDARSVRVLVPDCRGLDQNFHDVTVVDMGDLPESEVSIPELSDLAWKWPPAVIAHMWWRQPELEEMKQTLIPPWTVTRKVYMESLTSRHSGISNDILLFSDIGLLLAHHYRVHKKGIPHVAFRKNYMSQLHALLPCMRLRWPKGDRRSLDVRQ